MKFFDNFSRNSQIPNLMEIRPVEQSCCMLSDKLDMMELFVAFRSLLTRVQTQSVNELHNIRSNLNAVKPGSHCAVTVCLSTQCALCLVRFGQRLSH